VNDDGNDAAQTIATLGKWRFSGAMQLMGRADAALENLRRIGEQSGLRILPALRKPFDADTVRKILQAERLGDPPAAAVQVRLDEALKNGWIEVWYQPKIDLRKKLLAGCEAFARVRHPQHGVLPPRAFVSGANDASLRTLAEITLIKALKTGLELSLLGINLRIAINMNMDALVQVPVAEIVQEHRPKPERWAGLIIDVTEQQIVNNIPRIYAVAKHLRACNVKLAVDDFGRDVFSLLKVKDIPFAEMKLDRAFVTGCSTNPLNASICQSAVDLAHSFGSLAVGVGVEKAEDVAALAAMGCDLGQGFLFGQPMAEERFLALLKQRAASLGRAASG
jgi:EAL domain-containing protein (putative c-di-GMP-specific phosphodiesterase class I)